MKRRYLVLFAVVLALPVALPACGGESTTTIVETQEPDTAEDTTSGGLTPVDAPVTQRSVKACFEDGDAIVESAGPLIPNSESSINAESVFAIGPGGGRIGVAIAEQPWIARRLSREVAAESRYSVSISEDGRVVVIFESDGPTPEDKDLANECIGE